MQEHEDEKIEINDGEDLSYRSPEDIAPHELMEALHSLYLLGDDLYLRLQVTNIAVVDQFIMRLESQVLQRWIDEERTPIGEATFLNAQSQMWIFATYELLRTWRQRANEVLKLAGGAKLEERIATLEEDQGYTHIGHQMRAKQLRAVLDSPQLLERIQVDLRRAHIPFRRMEFIRMSLAKHEVAKQRNSIAFAPGYGRINMLCGSLDYQMEKGLVILGTINRRNIADELRAMNTRIPPTETEIRDFNAYMDVDPASLFDAPPGSADGVPNGHQEPEPERR